MLELRQIIKNYLINNAGADPVKLEDPYLRVSDLEIDSLGLIEMLFEVEDKYGFQIEEPVRFLKMTFLEMIDDIENSIRSQSIE